MEISRVIYIRDAGGQQGQTYLRGADAMAVTEQAASAPPPVAPPPPVNAAPPRVMLGTTASDVFIQVDFALREK
jgi:hypothetical protein